MQGSEWHDFAQIIFTQLLHDLRIPGAHLLGVMHVMHHISERFARPLDNGGK